MSSNDNSEATTMSTAATGVLGNKPKASSTRLLDTTTATTSNNQRNTSMRSIVNQKKDDWACTERATTKERQSSSESLLLTTDPNQSEESTLWSVVRSNAIIWVVPLLIFVALTVSGITIVLMHFDNQSTTKIEEAQSVASETGQRFSDFLDNSITPLFSLAQFVHELDEFRDLPNQIGPWDHEGSLPMRTNSTSHRNITGVCDKPHLVDRFDGIASSIKENAKQMQGVLVNLQLVPEGVVCLLHPVVNTEDFPEGKALNNTGAIGHDLMADPRRRFHAEESLKQGNLVVVGPITLVQCQGCDPIVEQAFIARLPILLEGHDIVTHDGQVLKKRWGFAVALINWQVLVEKTYLYEDFAVRGWGFQLTRLDHVFDAETDSYTTKTVVLAETDDYHNMANSPKQHQVVTAKLDTTDSEWIIRVVYSLENAPTWRNAAIVGIVFVNALISLLAFTVLYQKQVHSELVKSNLVRAELSARAERDLNDFIAHEIRNPLSAAMSAGTFLATTVEEEQQKIRERVERAAGASTEEERQALILPPSTDITQTISEDVGIINSSLHFINDLLRNLLDVHRAQSRQLVLELVETDLLTDVLEPVAAMLQHRDRDFAVHIDVDPQAPNPFIVEVDRLRLQQVVLNLGRNSAKFVTDGKHGFVRLKACVRQDGSIELSVEDSGSGIPLSKRSNLFGRFQESLDSLSQGTGVGLNLCKTLVELMGGELYLDERYDSGVPGYPGARFVVHLKETQVLDIATPPSVELELPDTYDDEEAVEGQAPDENKIVTGNGNDRIPTHNDLEMGMSAGQNRRTNNDQIEDTSTRSRANMDCSRATLGDRSERSSKEEHQLPKNLTILFADDERILRKLSLRAFSKLAPTWKVEETASGEAALKLVEEKNYDMIFLDQYYTSVERRLTGTETARAMRAKGVKSIICGVSANDLEGAFLKAGADVFATKPFATNQKQLKKFMLKALQKVER